MKRPISGPMRSNLPAACGPAGRPDPPGRAFCSCFAFCDTRNVSFATWGPAVCYGPPGKNAKVQEEENRKIIVFPWFFYDFLAKIGPRTSGKPVRLFWTGLSLPRPFPTHFTSILPLWFFFEQKNLSFFQVFPIFSLFLELRRLWDHSQIVDLIFLIRTVSTRAHETSKTPHSWQNNVPIPILFPASFVITGVW